jgi:leader peptidase (prepilin peptidase)/N-methyltransferase
VLETPLQSILVTLAGPVIGSFAATVAERRAAGVSPWRGRSRCAVCGHALAIKDLVPIASWFALGGRCRYCRSAIGRFEPAVEALALAIAIAAAAGFGDGQVWLAAGLGWALLAIAAADARAMVVPDLFVLPLTLAGLAATAWLAPDRLASHALAAVGALALFFAIRFGYRRLRGREGLGLGDAKLMAAAGAWLGPEPLPIVVLAAALAALAVTGLRQWREGRIDPAAPVPFGAYLAPAIWLVWLADPVGMF